MNLRLDCEDPSLIEDALDDACRKGIGIEKLKRLISGQSGKRGAIDRLRVLEEALREKEVLDEVQDS